VIGSVSRSVLWSRVANFLRSLWSFYDCRSLWHNASWQNSSRFRCDSFKTIKKNFDVVVVEEFRSQGIYFTEQKCNRENEMKFHDDNMDAVWRSRIMSLHLHSIEKHRVC